MTAAPPNIILILADSLRADSLGCYGNPHGTTPNIDAMAETGLRFETCYSTSPLCVPARSQLLSGKHCHETGNMGNQAWRFHTDQPVEVDGVCLDPAGSTLPAQMAASGYQTAHLGKNHFYPRDNGYGFNVLEQCDFYGRELYEKDDYYLFLKEQGCEQLHKDAFGRMDVLGTGGGGAVRESFGLIDRLCPYVSKLPAELQATPWLGNRARGFIRRQTPQAPFFLVTSFYAPHDPYSVSPPHHERIPWQEMKTPRLPEREEASSRHVGEQSLRAVLPDEIWKRNIAQYLANVALIDDEVGSIIDTLKKAALYENTLILVTSDHGDTLGEHRIWGKNLMYECCARIPLIAHHGGGKIGRGNSQETATLLDIYPTLLREAGIDFTGTRLAGKPLHLASPVTEPDHRTVIGELGNSRHPQYFIREGDWKLIYLDGIHARELYNLRDDPRELQDLSGKEPSVCARLLKTLERWLAKEKPYIRSAVPGADEVDMAELCRRSNL